MLKLIGWTIKVSIFALAVLVLGHLVHWRGRTISDQVKLQMAHAERSEWVEKAKTISVPSKEDIVRAATGHAVSAVSAGASTPMAKEEGTESIPSSERQKLRALIRELNGSRH